MAKFAPIAPPHLLKSMRNQWGDHILGDYHLVLAHDIVENYKQWENGQILPSGSTVIIDNSIIELGEPVSADIMEEAFNILGDSHAYTRVIVLPDVFDDPGQTFRQSQSYLHTLKDRGRPGFEAAQYMYVLQAATMEHMHYITGGFYVEELVRQGVEWVSIPRRIADRFGTRTFALYTVLQLQLIHPQLKIHLLGFSENVEDDIHCTLHSGVSGIDSAVPIRLGQQDKVIQIDYRGDQAGPRGTFWTDPHDKVSGWVGHNLHVVRSWLYGRVQLTDIYTPKLRPETIPSYTPESKT